MSAKNKTISNKKNLIDALEKHLGVVTSACKSVGISRVMFYKYYNTDPKFKEMVDDVQEVSLDFVESQMFNRIKKGVSDSLIIFYLKTKGKKRGYIETVENIHVKKDKFKNKSTEELKNRLEELRKIQTK